MRIRLFTFPQHVALRDGERWVPPFDLESYLAVMRRYLVTTPRLYLYTAGGMLLETAFVLIVCLLALQGGLPWLVLLVAGMSLGMLLVYMVFKDVPMAIRRGIRGATYPGCGGWRKHQLLAFYLACYWSGDG